MTDKERNNIAERHAEVERSKEKKMPTPEKKPTEDRIAEIRGLVRNKLKCAMSSDEARDLQLAVCTLLDDLELHLRK